MNQFTTKIFAEILIGIYILTLYLNSKFKSFILISGLFFLGAVLDYFTPNDFKLQMLISGLPILIVAVLGILEAKKFEKEGKASQVMQFKKINIVIGIILFSIYLLSRIFYFDMLHN